MPELPEVETVVRNIVAMGIIGRKIESIVQLCPKVFEPSIDENTMKALEKSSIISCTRRGKYIVFSLTSNQFLLLHLRMSGKVFFKPSQEILAKHTRCILRFVDCPYEFHFIDPRKFGRMTYVKNIEHYFQKLGPEPLESSFTPFVLAEILKGKNAMIKALLLDQKNIAGIGNIYADEALFYAKVHPQRLGKDLCMKEITALHAAIYKVLTESIVKGGSTIGTSVSNFLNAYRESGNNQTSFAVYQRTNKLCINCCSYIQKVVIASRSTHFCPHCQK